MDNDALSPAESALIETAIALTVGLDVRRICSSVLDALERIFDARSSWIMLRDPATGELVTADFRGPGAHTYAGVRIPADRGIVGLVFSSREAVFVPDVQTETRWFNPKRIQQSGLQSVLTAPVMDEDAPVGVVGVDTPRFSRERPPRGVDLARLRGVAAQAAVAIRKARLLDDIEQDRRRLRRLLHERRQLRSEVDHLRDTVRRVQAFSAVIGESPIWKAVLEQVALVSPADSTVLLAGETGTGKELIARAIHEQSRRRSQPFVAVNCAAFPESLVESELFGHERGAFTGAFERKPGKFELADRGTLFLDEVGDLQPSAQAKLLRALQEREIHRVGGTKAVPVNVRLIAATNRDLQEALRTGTLRPDLFYRLSVFPIALPPLRERPDDVPLLARYFVQRFAERQRIETPELTEAAVAELRSYHWPGNIRELQNVLERAVILTRSPAIGPELLHLSHPVESMTPGSVAAAPPAVVEPGPTSVLSFSESERRAILKALESTGWRISGSGGAAELLGLKPTTLHAKMKRLGVHRPVARAAPSDQPGPQGDPAAP